MSGKGYLLSEKNVLPRWLYSSFYIVLWPLPWRAAVVVVDVVEVVEVEVDVEVAVVLVDPGATEQPRANRSNANPTSNGKYE